MSGLEKVIIGDLVLPNEVLINGFVKIRDGKIEVIGSGAAPAAASQYDARGSWVFPGVIDGQTHTGSQADREGIRIGTRAAAAGGVTTIVDMPYDDPQPVTNAELFRGKISVVEREAHVDVALYATIAKHDGAGALPELIEAGACAVKLSTYESHPTRFPRISPIDMFTAMEILGKHGLTCGIHNENQEVVDVLSKRLQDANDVAVSAHGRSRPPLAELLAIADSLRNWCCR